MEIEDLENPPTKFMPCDVVVTPEGAIFIADGYGSDRIYEMTFEDQLVRQWGGRRAKDPANLSNAHVISLALSDPKGPSPGFPPAARTRSRPSRSTAGLLRPSPFPARSQGRYPSGLTRSTPLFAGRRRTELEKDWPNQGSS
jgi:hypothetical protein